jgi:precorrin-6Y C5,15-methyltransferase (decarboxylating)
MVMSEHPWLTIIGLGEDGPDGLSPASLAALEAAEIVMGPPRHLSLLPDHHGETRVWPVPFADGVAQLLALRGRRVVVLASGDPFWFGAGRVLARELAPQEWRSFPNLSCFALAANRLGWALETTTCLGCHAAPISRLRPHLHDGARLIVTLRDRTGPEALAAYLGAEGFAESSLHVMEALGGPRERVTSWTAAELEEHAETEFTAPLCVAVAVAGAGRMMPKASGLTDDWFDHDGQITKRPVRALTLSTLAPRPMEHLWDIGGGSGSVAIEWLLAHPMTEATTVEIDPARAARITQNAARLGVDRLRVEQGDALEVIDLLAPPDAVFVGGGLSEALLQRLSERAKGARLVVNAVTLESEMLLTQWQARLGGDLLRLALSEATPLGRKRGWRSSYPIVQWSVTL